MIKLDDVRKFLDRMPKPYTFQIMVAPTLDFNTKNELFWHRGHDLAMFDSHAKTILASDAKTIGLGKPRKL